MKCYYTYGATPTTPTTSDTEYTEPVKMLRGKNIFPQYWYLSQVWKVKLHKTYIN